MMRQRMIVSLMVFAASSTILLVGGNSSRRREQCHSFSECLSSGLYDDGAASNVVSVVRTKIDNCVAALPNNCRGDPGYMREFGMPGELRQPEIELGMSVSNNIESVYMNFSVLATNLVERRLLLASTWRLGDDFYLDCLSRNVDLAIAGVITADDLEWYMRGHRTRRLTYMLAAQYDRPGVSNIVLRLMSYTGETNKYEKVLNGEAKTEYLAFEQFMAEGPESSLKGN